MFEKNIKQTKQMLYTMKLAGILALFFVTCNIGFSQNLQSEEEELLRSLNGEYSANVTYPEIETFYLQKNSKTTNKSNVQITQTGNNNSSQVFVIGNSNNTELFQQGNKNIYKLEMTGNRNTTKASQIGSENYLEDIILSNDNFRETIQIGYGNAIHNEGIQNIPMTIQQRGVNMKVKISGRP